MGSARSGITVEFGEGKRVRTPCAASSKDPYLPPAAHFCWAGAQPGRAPSKKLNGGLALPLPSPPRVHLGRAGVAQEAQGCQRGGDGWRRDHCHLNDTAPTRPPPVGPCRAARPGGVAQTRAGRDPRPVPPPPRAGPGRTRPPAPARLEVLPSPHTESSGRGHTLSRDCRRARPPLIGRAPCPRPPRPLNYSPQRTAGGRGAPRGTPGVVVREDPARCPGAAAAATGEPQIP